MLNNLEGEFSKAREGIEKSKTKEDMQKEAKAGIEYVAKLVEDCFKSLEQSEETASGKISSLRGAASIFELVVGKYKEIIDSDEKLKSLVESKRKMLKMRLKKLEEEQAKADAKAGELGLS